jgi:N4-gp56 family major capsid protein
MEHAGKPMWEDVASYADGAGATSTAAESKTNVGQGEIGRIGQFRFIVVYDMPVWFGQGADATDGTDNDGDGIEDAGANINSTDGRYDAFPLLVVGSGSYETYSLEGDTARVKHGEPRVIPGIDNHGDKGSIAIAWYFGLLVNKPEWIRTLICSAKIA